MKNTKVQYFRSFRVPIEKGDQICGTVSIGEERADGGLHEIAVNVENLSMSGVGLNAQSAVPLDLVVGVELVLGGEKFSFQAKVVRCSPGAQGFVWGLVFLNDGRLELKHFMNALIRTLSPHRLKKHLLDLMKDEALEVQSVDVNTVKLFTQIFQEVERLTELEMGVEEALLTFLDKEFTQMKIDLEIGQKRYERPLVDKHLNWKYKRSFAVTDLEGENIGKLSFSYNDLTENDNDKMESFASCTTYLLPYLLELSENVTEQETIRFFKPTAPREFVMIGPSEEMKKIRGFVAKTKKTSDPVLIKGAFGTGKTLLAEIIHSEGERRGMPLIVLDGVKNWSREELKEFFNNKESSLINGSLLLRGVHMLSLEAQNTLYEVLYGESAILLDVRVISTVVEDIEDRVRSGLFHEELFRKLKKMNIRLPSLLERSEDVVSLANYFLKTICEELSSQPKKFSIELLEKIKGMAWCDNIEGLRRAIYHAIELNPNASVLSTKNAILGLSEGEDENMLEIFAECLEHNDLPDKDLIMLFEYHLISQRIEFFDKDKSAAALSLGISLKRLNLKLDMVETLLRRELRAA